MNPWNILELAPTVDSKEIKRAYARKLKITKPDEKPNEFQSLYEAYQIALHYSVTSPLQNESAIETSVDALEEIEKQQTDSDQQPIIKKSNSQSELNSSEEEAYRIRNDEFEALLKQVNNLLAINSVGPVLTEWRFLAASPCLLENNFNWCLGGQIFKIFSEYLQQRIRSRGRYYNRYITKELIHYCDQLFSWKENRQFLEREYSEGFCATLFSKLDEPLAMDANMGLRGGKLISPPVPTKPQPVKYDSEDSSASVIFQAIIILGFMMAMVRQFLSH